MNVRAGVGVAVGCRVSLSALPLCQTRFHRPIAAASGQGRPGRRMSGSPAAGGSSPSRRSGKEAGSERVPLFSPAVDSPMGTLKHRTGGSSLGDLLAPQAAADERGAVGGGSPGAAAPTSAGAAGGLTPAVLLCVAVASMGALSFGYHLGVVNGPLEVLAQQLGFGGNAVLQGMVSSTEGLRVGRPSGRRGPARLACCPLLHSMLTMHGSGSSTPASQQPSTLKGYHIYLCPSLPPDLFWVHLSAGRLPCFSCRACMLSAPT